MNNFNPMGFFNNLASSLRSSAQANRANAPQGAQNTQQTFSPTPMYIATGLGTTAQKGVSPELKMTQMEVEQSARYVKELLNLPKDVATIISYGPISQEARNAAEKLTTMGIGVRLLVLNSVTHFSEAQLLEQICGKHVFVLEEVCSGSGISEATAMCLQKREVPCEVHTLDLGRDFVPHGDMKSLYHKYGLDCDSITNYVCEVLRGEN